MNDSANKDRHLFPIPDRDVSPKPKPDEITLVSPMGTEGYLWDEDEFPADFP